MKILKVIHGYPPRYSAGSEIYSQTLCHELVQQGHEVVVFTREENAYRQEYSVTWDVDPDLSDVRLCLVNMAHSKDGYQHAQVDRAFAQLLEAFCPDVVHIGHLNHLSTSLVSEAHNREIPVIFTLHDFWLMCPRGQFLQAINSKTEDLYPACEGQQNRKCALKCYWRYFSSQEDEEDVAYWTGWVEKRMNHVRKMSSQIDHFIAPSHYLMDRFVEDFHIPESKISYLDYGFNRSRLAKRRRCYEGESFVFGYIGTHKQAKGIHHLIEAFRELKGNVELKIWGSPVEPFTKSLKEMIAQKGDGQQKRIQWMGEYKNDRLVVDVFNRIDAIVVPSIWGENSPLVIHEALEAGVAVITADYGGMKEYVHHEINGLLFSHRNPKSLADQMRRLVNDSDLVDRLSRRGYLQSPTGHIPDIETHTKAIEKLYIQIMEQKRSTSYVG